MGMNLWYLCAVANADDTPVPAVVAGDTRDLVIPHRPSEVDAGDPPVRAVGTGWMMTRLPSARSRELEISGPIPPYHFVGGAGTEEN